MPLVGCLVTLLLGCFAYSSLGPLGVVGYVLVLAGVAYLGAKAEAEKKGRRQKRAAAKRRDGLPSQARRAPSYAGVQTSMKLNVGSADSIEAALDMLDIALLKRSGSVFYSGKEAFTGTRQLYILGLNPGGDPVQQRENTVQRHIEEFRGRSAPWSAYADDSWEQAPPGSWGMQPRVLHMLERLGLDPRLTPASNIVFVRTRDEAALKAEASRLIRECWNVHQAVIETLGVRAVVCFGGTAGAWVRRQLAADELFDEFREANARGWRSTAHRSSAGKVVVTATHPGRADWRNPKSDPTPLIMRSLE